MNMEKVIYCVCICVFGIFHTLCGQEYYGNLLAKAQEHYLLNQFPKALEYLDLLERSDRENFYLNQRQSIRNRIFQAIEKQTRELTLSKESEIRKKDSLQNLLTELNKTLDTLKNKTEREVLSLFKDAEAIQNNSSKDALTKILTAKSIINLSPYVKETKLSDHLDTAYHKLGVALINKINDEIKDQKFDQALSNFPILVQLPHFSVDSINRVQARAQNLIVQSIKLDIELFNHLNALEETHLLRHFEQAKDLQTHLYLELAFCFTITQNFEKTNLVLDSVAKLLNISDLPLLQLCKNAAQKQKLQLLEPLIKQHSSTIYHTIKNRYLPTHFEIISSNPNSKTAPEIKEFSLARTELSFFEYDLFCVATNREKPSENGWGRGDWPAIDVSWYDALAYCNWRSILEGLDKCYQLQGDTLMRNPLKINFTNASFQGGNGYRLPTEAEWQFAAGNGMNTRYSWGDEEPSVTPVGNLADASANKALTELKTFAYYNDGYPFTAPKAQFAPNQFHLYDMSGNVWEWCWDEYKEKQTQPFDKKKKQVTNAAAERIVKGGAWSSYPTDNLVSQKMHFLPTKANFSTGFRIAKND